MRVARAQPGRLTWRKLLNQVRGLPDLTWILLPPYEIPGMAVISSVMVENRGRGKALNVKIELSYGAENGHVIHHMEILSDDPYIVRGGGDRHSFVTVRLREMRPGSLVIIYFASHDLVTPNVSVTSYQKSPWTRVKALVADAPAPEPEVGASSEVL
jgi:hypothetical protein